MNVDIERATAEDGPSILQLLRDAEPPVDGLLDHLDTAFVARVDGRIIGCAALEMYEGGALLRSVAVASVVQGFGIGRRLTGAPNAISRSSPSFRSPERRCQPACRSPWSSALPVPQAPS
jgi:N-acetylglutamate synthase-like GNAT family acetyltransferase